VNLNSWRYAPLWAAQVFTGTKSFAGNPLLGSPALNRWGLHVARVRLAHALTLRRRRRLGRGLPPVLRAALDRDGFALCPDFLPEPMFAQLRGEVEQHRTAARERSEGDTLLRKIDVDAVLLQAAPALRALLENALFRALLAYVEGRHSAPAVYLQTVLQRAHVGAPDPQCQLHRDTFHPTAKAWLYLTDVPEHAGPLVYVPGSHRLTPARMAWEGRMSVAATLMRKPLTSSFRVDPAELRALGYAEPRALGVRSNTLVVADTFGFHARGRSAGPSRRVEVWAIGRRTPFLPFFADRLLQRLGRPQPAMDWRRQAQTAAFDIEP
jgi:hypothetical protein